MENTASSGTIGSGAGPGAQTTGSASTHGGTGGSAGASNDDEPLDIFDPGEVYVWGTLRDNPCDEALAPIREPNRAATGFWCAVGRDWSVTSPVISPVDGRLLYTPQQIDAVLAFTADGNGLDEYPFYPHDNDPVLMTLCGESHDFFVDPDDGEIVSMCGGPGERVYYRAGGEPWNLDPEYFLEHLGYGETALVVNDFTGWAIKAEDGEIIQPETQIRPGVSVPVRARPDGFWFVTAFQGHYERWHLALDGSVTFEGEFPQPEPPTALWFIGHQCALEAGGALVCLGFNENNQADERIARAELGASRAEVVYSESQSPLVQLHGSALFTGP